MSVEDTLLEAEEKMIKTDEHVQHEFVGVRTGKASPALVENVQIEAYGTPMRLKEVAGISTPEPRMILIQPWDVGTVSAIEKGIQAANLGLNPAVDGKVIRVVIPELSEERRQEFVKLAKDMAEKGRVAVRHERRQARVRACHRAGGERGDGVARQVGHARLRGPQLQVPAARPEERLGQRGRRLRSVVPERREARREE